MCPSASLLCLYPRSELLRNSFPGRGHRVCLGADDHRGDSCDHLPAAAQEGASQEAGGGRHRGVRTQREGQAPGGAGRVYLHSLSE